MMVALVATLAGCHQSGIPTGPEGEIAVGNEVDMPQVSLPCPPGMTIAKCFDLLEAIRRLRESGVSICVEAGAMADATYANGTFSYVEDGSFFGQSYFYPNGGWSPWVTISNIVWAVEDPVHKLTETLAHEFGGHILGDDRTEGDVHPYSDFIGAICAGEA